MKNCVLLVHSGDKSQPYWKYWLHYWKKHWKCADVCDTIFLGETKSLSANGIITEKTGPRSWAKGLINCLTRIAYKYVIYYHEDYLLDENSFPVLLSDLLSACDKHDMKMLKCCGWWAGDPDWNKDNAFGSTDIMIKGINGKEAPLWLYNQSHMYLISHQCAIWDREFMISTINPSHNPWENEIYGTEDLRKRNIPIYCYREKCPIPYGELLQHGCVRDGMQKFIDEAEKEGVQEVEIV